jgi:hypothetical protein
VWHWEARHPEWEAGATWGPDVSSYAIDDGDRLLLFDPLAMPSEIEELAAGRETAIAGDPLSDGGNGLEFPFDVGVDEQQFGATCEQILESLYPLLKLPVELLLPAHGAPTDRAALERVLS